MTTEEIKEKEAKIKELKKLKPTRLYIKCHKCWNQNQEVKDLCYTCGGLEYLPVFTLPEPRKRRSKKQKTNNNGA